LKSGEGLKELDEMRDHVGETHAKRRVR